MSRQEVDKWVHTKTCCAGTWDDISFTIILLILFCQILWTLCIIISSHEIILVFILINLTGLVSKNNIQTKISVKVRSLMIAQGKKTIYWPPFMHTVCSVLFFCAVASNMCKLGDYCYIKNAELVRNRIKIIVGMFGSRGVPSLH